MKNTVPLSLHIPEPQGRPGDAADFSGLTIPPAGAAPRPQVGVHARDTHALAYDLIRVLDDQGGRGPPTA